MKYLSRLLLSLLFIMIVVELTAQDSDLIPFRDKENDKWGYKNSSDRIVISPFWDHAGEFSDGLARVYIYDTVIKSYRYYFVNKKGEDVFEKHFSDAGYFYKGRAIVSDMYKGKYYFINTEGDSLSIAFDELLNSIPGTRFQIVRKDSLLSIVYQGVLIFLRESEPWYDIVTPLKSGYIIFKWHNNGKYGLLNNTGYAVLQPQYDSLTEDNDGFFVVKKDGKFALANPKDGTTHGFLYDNIESLAPYRYKAMIDGKWGIIDTQNIVLADFRYDEIKLYQKQYYQTTIEKLHGLIDLHGKEIFSPRFEKPLIGNKGDLFVFFQNNMYGVINAKNKIILPAVHKSIKLFDFSEFPPSGNFIAVRNDTNYYVVYDTAGKIISGQAYTEIKDFDSNGFAIVYLEWFELAGGVINSEFEQVIPCQYEEINRIIDPPVFLVQDKNFLWGMFDYKGNQLTQCEYKQIRPFSEGMAAVEKDRKWGFINSEGQLVVPCQYERVGDFKNGRAFIGLQKYVDKTGRVFYTQ